jgi:hypothetical protein
VILRQAKSRKSSGLIEKYCISDWPHSPCLGTTCTLPHSLIIGWE